MTPNYICFDSPVGPIAIAWTEKGICFLQLSEGSQRKTVERLKKHFPEATEAEPPAFVAKAKKLLLLHLEGKSQDFSGIPLDLGQCTEFSRNVYEAARKVPAGIVATYSDIAKRIQGASASRAVGRALGSNPVAIIVPCHRIIGKNGKMTGFSAYGGCNTKIRLLSIEHALSSDKISTATFS